MLHYRQTGNTGTPVVLVHGSLGDLDDWGAQVRPFASSHRVLAYARRYHSPNPPLPDTTPYSPVVHAQDLSALLDSLHVGPAHIVGASYGAYVALLLALERPDLVRSLVLGEPPVLPLLMRTPQGDSLRRRFIETAMEPARAAMGRGDSLEAFRRLTDDVTGVPGRFDRLPAGAQSSLLAQTGAMRRALQTDPRVFSPPLPCAALGRIASPVLLLHGDRSPRMFHVIAEELARCLNSEATVLVPHAGHRMERDNPTSYNEVVLRFLAEH